MLPPTPHLIVNADLCRSGVSADSAVEDDCYWGYSDDAGPAGWCSRCPLCFADDAGSEWPS